MVDDEDSVRLLVQRTLEHFGYQVLTAFDGEQALTTYVTFEEARQAGKAVLDEMIAAWQREALQGVAA